VIPDARPWIFENFLECSRMMDETSLCKFLIDVDLTHGALGKAENGC